MFVGAWAPICVALVRRSESAKKNWRTGQEFIAPTSPDVERGVRNPTVTVLEKIARALKVKASSLL